jgi:hypothetical protein
MHGITGRLKKYRDGVACCCHNAAMNVERRDMLSCTDAGILEKHLDDEGRIGG